MEEREEEKVDGLELKMVAAEDTEEGKKRQFEQQENVRKPKSVRSEAEKGTRQAARGACLVPFPSAYWHSSKSMTRRMKLNPG